jgi:hypothetical protein
MTEKKVFSLADFDEIASNSIVYDMEYMLPNGEPSGLMVGVYGDKAVEVTSYVMPIIDKAQAKEDMLKKMGKPYKETIADKVEFGRKNAACRIAYIKPIVEPFNFDTALKYVSQNPSLRDQVMEASTNLGNFMRSK